jgi:putative membrane protein insertion efficiency factor
MTEEGITQSRKTPQSFVVSMLCLILKCYHATLSKAFPAACRFYPSCSEYAAGSLKKHGLLRGGARALYRLLRCAPWSSGGVDLP